MTDSREEQAPERKAWWSGTKGTIALIGTIVAIIAGTVTTVLTITNRPRPFAIQDWVHKANAICDQAHAEVEARRRDATDFLSQLQDVTDPATQLEGVARVIDAVADVQRQLIGNLRTIDTPEDREADVETTFKIADKVDLELTAVAKDLRSADPMNSNLALDSASERLTAIDSENLSLAESFRSIGSQSCATTIEP